MSASYAGKLYTSKDLLRHEHAIGGDKKVKCHLCPYLTARKDKPVSHQKTHTNSSSFQSLNRKRKASEAELQLSSKKISVSKESQQLSNLKQKITHQEPTSSPKQA